MDARSRFSKSINSLFKHSSVAGFYQKVGAEKVPVRVIVRQPDPLYELGDRQIVVDQYRIDVRVSELASPKRGGILFVNQHRYSIEEEPKMDQHQLVWILDCLPVSPVVNNGSRLRLR